MIVIQLRFEIKQPEGLLAAHVELDLLKREDATDLEWNIAQQVEEVFKFTLEEILKPQCKTFDMRIIK
jgi:hypothetical protein